MASKAVFFDRDGTLMEEVCYCNDPAKVRAFPGTAQALRQLKEAGFKNIIITNQSGIGRGRITPEQFEAVQQALLEQLGPDTIDATYFCPDTPDQPSTRRKPLPGMVLEAIADHGIDPSRSFFIGDKSADIECGRAAGARTVLVETGYGAEQDDCNPHHRFPDVVAAVEYILANPLPNNP